MKPGVTKIIQDHIYFSFDKYKWRTIKIKIGFRLFWARSTINHYQWSISTIPLERQPPRKKSAVHGTSPIENFIPHWCENDLLAMRKTLKRRINWWSFSSKRRKMIDRIDSARQWLIYIFYGEEPIGQILIAVYRFIILLSDRWWTVIRLIVLWSWSLISTHSERLQKFCVALWWHCHPFVSFVRRLFKGNFHSTVCHAFLRARLAHTIRGSVKAMILGLDAVIIRKSWKAYSSSDHAFDDVPLCQSVGCHPRTLSEDVDDSNSISAPIRSTSERSEIHILMDDARHNNVVIVD